MEVFIIMLILAAVAGLIAKNKGRNFWGPFLLSFLLTPLGGLLIALVMKRDQKELDRVAVEAGEARRCPFCAETVRRDAIVCRYCGRDLPDFY